MGIFSHDEDPCWSDVIYLEEQVKELKAENERLKESNEELTSDNLNTIQEMDNERRRVEQLKEENELLREENLEEQKQYTEVVSANAQKIRQLKHTLQEIKAIATALYMNNWVQMNETARESVRQLQDLVNQAEEE